MEGFASDEAGDRTVTISYTEGEITKTASFTVHVKAPVPAVLESIEVTPPSKTEYEIGEEFDGSGMTVTARYSDGSEKTLEAGAYFVSGFSSVKAGEVMVTVSYTEGDVTKTAEFTVTVNPGEEPGDLGQDAGGIFHQHREGAAGRGCFTHFHALLISPE